MTVAAATAPAPAPQPVTVVVADPVKVETAARDAADAKAWESITGEQPGENDIPEPDFAKMAEEGKTTEPGRGPDGKFVKGDKTATEDGDDESATEAEKKPPADKKPEPKKDDKPLDREMRRKIIAAKEVVGRILKFDDDKLDAMEPEELIDLGQRLKPVFKTVESLQTDLQKWKDRARGQKPTDTDTPDDGRGRTAEPDDKAEPQPAEREPRGGIDKLLQEYLDPDTLAQVRSGRKAELSRFQEQATKASERAQAAESRMRLDRIEVGRDRVAEKFPQLKDDARFQKLLEAMDEMDPHGERAGGDLTSFVKFMERVAWSEFGEDVERTTRQKLITGNRKDANNQPETTSHGSQPNAMTWEQYEEYVAWATTSATNKADFDQKMARVKRPAKK